MIYESVQNETRKQSASINELFLHYGINQNGFEKGLNLMPFGLSKGHMKKQILLFSVLSMTCIHAQNVEIVTNVNTGRTWMNKNLGASQVATSITDENAYGDLFQWGRQADGHQLRTSSTTTVVSQTEVPANDLFILGVDDWLSPENNNLWQGVNGINNPCPEGFRVPTAAEWEEEMSSWSSTDGEGAFASPLKLTLAGARSRMSGTIGNLGTFGGYRTSTTDGQGFTKTLGISPTVAMMGSRARADGNCVRCIQDEEVNISFISNQKLIDVYPNPVIKTLNILIERELIGMPYFLTNSLGEKIGEGILLNAKSTIDMTHLKNGLYVLSIQSDECPIRVKVLKR
ncbi:T9SS type A sorting domain-containing protein [bacterium]|nr:T9SS type A sorting domain-containing protein [Crocinitomicaceae bacterium]MDA9020538.1 T9SS type A sorting domain-containing protein [bacterium]MDC0272148.1 T9SS type A sorting domain-containing protein [Crocinitomicaceae bacterium]MDO7609319.1 T9SS type A sorting domain-containing protein [Crocinitomicaceae bacterium]